MFNLLRNHLSKLFSKGSAPFWTLTSNVWGSSFRTSSSGSSYKVTLTLLPLSDEVSLSSPVPSPWTLDDLYDYINWLSTVKMILHDFQAQIIRMPCTSSLLSWNACSGNPAAMLWGRPTRPEWSDHTEESRIGCPTASPSEEPAASLWQVKTLHTIPVPPKHQVTPSFQVTPAETADIIEQRIHLFVPCLNSWPTGSRRYKSKRIEWMFYATKFGSVCYAAVVVTKTHS